MTTEPVADALRVARLEPADLVETMAFLDRRPVLNVFLAALVLRDALAHPRDEFWGAWRGSELDGVVYLGADSGLVAPAADAPDAIRPLALAAARRVPVLPPRRHLVGGREAVRAFETVLRDRLPPPRLRRDQLYLRAHGQAPGRPALPDLRPARPEDEESLYATGVALRIEELAEDPRAVDEAAYRRQVQSECRDGTTFVWREPDGLRFRATIGAMTPSAAQISAVYTPPEFRNRGYATRALGELCRRLLERVDHVCLFVNEHNLAARAVYAKLGFTLEAEWRSVFWPHGA